MNQPIPPSPASPSPSDAAVTAGPFARAAGVLLHPTSLPSPHGVGDLGEGARRFVDWLAAARCAVWQILPLVPPGAGESPYSSPCAFGGNAWLLDLRALHADGLLDAADLTAPAFSPDRVDHGGMQQFKAPRLRKATDALFRGAAPALLAELDAFRAAEPWAEDYALFDALRVRRDYAPWWTWEAGLRDRVPAAMAAARDALRAEVDHRVALQFLFQRQWDSLRAYAGVRGVRILGDLPIYVDRDSVDVWANQAQFRLKPDGSPVAVAGVPPDYFSETGQLWGNPLYDWEAMAADGHAWWVARLRRALSLTDLVRIDHFRAFSAFWEVPADAQDARGGRWVPGPGMRFFDDLRAALGDALPIVAEDLGTLDDAVHALRAEVALPGMRILQFAFGEDADHAYLPHNYDAATVAYTGTHDNDTTRGWWNALDERVRDHIRRYLAIPGHDVTWDLIRAAMASVASLAIFPMQDVLDLDSGARMNLPGVADGNWSWRVRQAAFHPDVSGRLAGLSQLYSRDEAFRPED